MESFFTLLLWPWDEQDKGSQRELAMGRGQRSERGQGWVMGRDKGLEQQVQRIESWPALAAAPWESWCGHHSHFPGQKMPAGPRGRQQMLRLSLSLAGPALQPIC